MHDDPIEVAKVATEAVIANTEAVEANTEALDPIAVAERAAAAVEGNTKALGRVLDRQRWLWGMVAALVLSTVGGVALYAQQAQVQQEACEQRNEIRAGLLDVRDFLEPNISDTADGRGLVLKMGENFALVDC